MPADCQRAIASDKEASVTERRAPEWERSERGRGRMGSVGMIRRVENMSERKCRKAGWGEWRKDVHS